MPAVPLNSFTRALPPALTVTVRSLNNGRVPVTRKIAVGFAVRLGDVQQSAPVEGRDVVHRVVRSIMILVPVAAGTAGHTQPVVELVGDRGVVDPPVPRIVGRLGGGLPVGAGVVAVVP